MPTTASAFERAAGVLLHPTSLPGPFGCGDLGPEAYRFVDLLAASGQSWWQVLPLTPPGPAWSPYAARSAFAGSPLLVSPEPLRDLGLLTDADLAECATDSQSAADFDVALGIRDSLLRTAFARVSGSGLEERIAEFAEREASWLDPYAWFAALKDADPRAWTDWPRRARVAPPAHDSAPPFARIFHAFVQWAFDEQWHALRAYAAERGVRLLGDLPIFVDLDSADVWAERNLFRLDAEGRPEVIAGVPPDAFTDLGQRWGNPHYRWDVMAADGYRWWVRRLRRTFDLFDAVRVDHFRGFAAAWEVPADAEDARSGIWAPGPGAALFEAASGQLGPLRILAEDLGVITPDVEALRQRLGFPGMRVLQFAFDGSPANPYLPHNFDPNTVVYTGTHDNDTTFGWWQSLDATTRDRVRHYLARDGSDPVSDLIRLAYGSVAALAMIPFQDVLELGGDARMNVPGTAQGNWNWRFSWDQVHDGRLAWLRTTAAVYGRTATPAFTNELPQEAGPAHPSG